MLSLRDVAAGLCAACSNEGSVFRMAFDSARLGEPEGQRGAAPTITGSSVKPSLNMYSQAHIN